MDANHLAARFNFEFVFILSSYPSSSLGTQLSAKLRFVRWQVIHPPPRSWSFVRKRVPKLELGQEGKFHELGHENTKAGCVAGSHPGGMRRYYPAVPPPDRYAK